MLIANLFFWLKIYRFFNSSILLLLFFALTSLLKRLSIQYVYERVFFFNLRLSINMTLKGAKVINSFTSQAFEKKIWKLISNPFRLSL
jgi:hypothetical protein